MQIKEKPSTIVRSLSGLINYQGLVIGVSDEFNGLFVRSTQDDRFYSFETSEIQEISYSDRKKIKADHESISLASYGGNEYLIAFPSLSKANRDRVGIVRVDGTLASGLSFSPKTVRVDQLFKQISTGSIEVNIEGHFQHENSLYLLNRGNQNDQNELIRIQNSKDWLEHCVRGESDSAFTYLIERHPVDLGSFEGFRLQWTDSIHDRDNQFLFLATIEKTTNSYDDGDVLCSFLGRYDFATRRVLAIKKILDFKKAEGLCIWNSRFLVCIDSDSEEMSSEFYSFPLDLLD